MSAETGFNLDNDKGSERSFAFERLVFFSDAVFAIALTLLALDLKPPDLGANLTSSQFLDLIFPAIENNLISFVLSFILVAVYWNLHHRMFGYIKHFNSTLVILNFVFLFGVVFLSFPTALLGEYGNLAAVNVIYWGTLMGIGFASTALWLYATRQHRLVEPDLSQRIINNWTVRSILILGVFAVATVASLFVPEYSPWFGLLILPVRFVLARLFADEEPKARAQPGGAKAR